MFRTVFDIKIFKLLVTFVCYRYMYHSSKTTTLRNNKFSRIIKEKGGDKYLLHRFQY